MKKSKNMHGFLCRSDVSTAVCVPTNTRSVVVPRRPDRTLVDRAILLDFNNYSRLLESRRRLVSKEPNDGTEENKKKRSVVVPVPTKRNGDNNTASSAPPLHTDKTKAIRNLQPLTTTIATTGDVFQVVVMRVSIHCQGCAGKIKKHISKMDGVTSFSIDLEAKRVTVMGNISPVRVLESISKVKKAEFWHS